MQAGEYESKYGHQLDKKYTHLWHGQHFQPPHVERSDDCQYKHGYNPVHPDHRVPNQAGHFGPMFGLADKPRPKIGEVAPMYYATHNGGAGSLNHRLCQHREDNSVTYQTYQSD